MTDIKKASKEQVARGRKEDGSPNDIDLYIGRQLRKIRKNLNISQVRLAEELGVTFQQVQKYENAKNRISASRLYQICKILKVSISEFLPD